MDSVVYSVAVCFLALSSLGVIWLWGWQTAWTEPVGPQYSRKSPPIGMRYLEERRSFNTIQYLFNDPHNSTLANLSVHHPNNISEANSPSAVGPRIAVRPEGPPTKLCRAPRHNIVFFKMHKCSSSTMQNVLMRYGDARNLTFVLPPRGNYLGYRRFTRRAMFDFAAKEYNILCHHTQFSYQGMSSVMPKDSAWTSIIRDPIEMFESNFYYRKFDNAFGLAKERDPLAIFSWDPEKYLTKFGHRDYGKSPMLNDLGLPFEQRSDVDRMRKFISTLGSQFDLVLITEFFEESVILLKELMCWELDDVVYFVVNARTKATVHAVHPEVRARLEDWNRGDVMLYEFFNRTLWEKVEAFGVDRMRVEVARLRARNGELQARCIVDPERSVNKGGVYHPSGIEVKGLVLKPGMDRDPLCRGMATPELQFTSYLLEKQKRMYGFSKR